MAEYKSINWFNFAAVPTIRAYTGNDNLVTNIDQLPVEITRMGHDQYNVIIGGVLHYIRVSGLSVRYAMANHDIILKESS